MKRILLFLATNLAVLLVIPVSLRLLGVDRFLTANGLDIGTLMVFSVVVGFAGSIVSLLVSRRPPEPLPQSLRTFGITDVPAWLGLFASHPPIEAPQHHRATAAVGSR